MSEESSNKPVEPQAQEDSPEHDESQITPDVEAEPSEALTQPATAGRGSTVAGRITKAVIVTVVVVGVGGLLVWWLYRPSPEQLTAEDIFVLQSLEDAQAALQQLQDDVQSLTTGFSAYRAEVEALGSDLEVLPTEIGALRRQVEALQGGSVDSRASWLREQAAYYLLLANSELRLAGRVTNSITALELADDVLRDLGDPALADVRRAVAEELQSLRGVTLPDFERHLADLAGLIARVPELPMRASVPENFSAPEESLDAVEPGLGRLWERTKGAVTSIVRVERQEAPVAVLLTDSERRIVRRQLALELQLARTALFERREQTFRASLVAADGILNRDFDRDARSIMEARRLLAAMMQVEVEPELPQIGDSLTLLRAALGAD